MVAGYHHRLARMVAAMGTPVTRSKRTQSQGLAGRMTRTAVAPTSHSISAASAARRPVNTFSSTHDGCAGGGYRSTSMRARRRRRGGRNLGHRNALAHVPDEVRHNRAVRTPRSPRATRRCESARRAPRSRPRRRSARDRRTRSYPAAKGPRVGGLRAVCASAGWQSASVGECRISYAGARVEIGTYLSAQRNPDDRHTGATEPSAYRQRLTGRPDQHWEKPCGNIWS